MKKKKSTKKDVKHFIRPAIENPEELIKALLESIENLDKESFREILAGYIVSMNKTELAEITGMGRRTLYDLLDPEIEFNPSLNTIFALIAAIKKEIR